MMMRQVVLKKWHIITIALMLVVMAGCFGRTFLALRAENEPTPGETQEVSGPVELAGIDYDNLTVSIRSNGNTIIYYSTNKSTWYEADGIFESGTGDNNKQILRYDISWVSVSKDTTLYFRGNTNNSTLSVEIPGYNGSFKAKFMKSSGDVEFDNTENSKIIRWRKTTDYEWKYVYADTNIKEDKSDTVCGKDVFVQSHENFKAELEKFRVKNVKLHFQTVPENYVNASNPGTRASKEVKVTVAAKRNAPIIKVNVKKLTVNTKETQEYNTETASPTSSAWKSCAKAMAVNTVAPGAFTAATGAAAPAETTVYFRTASTSTNCESKVTAVKIPARPQTTTTKVTLEASPGKQAGKGKVKVTFSNLPSQGVEYVISTDGKDIANETTEKWKTVKKAKTITITEAKLPTGARIFYRDAGVALNVNRGIELKLPSVPVSTAAVTYPPIETTTK